MRRKAMWPSPETRSANFTSGTGLRDRSGAPEPARPQIGEGSDWTDGTDFPALKQPGQLASQKYGETMTGWLGGKRFPSLRSRSGASSQQHAQNRSSPSTERISSRRGRCEVSLSDIRIVKENNRFRDRFGSQFKIVFYASYVFNPSMGKRSIDPFSKQGAASSNMFGSTARNADTTLMASRERLDHLFP